MHSYICPLGYRIPQMLLQLIPIFLVNNIITFPISNDATLFYYVIIMWYDRIKELNT
jgi:hypothetical protein